MVEKGEDNLSLVQSLLVSSNIGKCIRKIEQEIWLRKVSGWVFGYCLSRLQWCLKLSIKVIFSVSIMCSWKLIIRVVMVIVVMIFSQVDMCLCFEVYQVVVFKLQELKKQSVQLFQLVLWLNQNSEVVVSDRISVGVSRLMWLVQSNMVISMKSWKLMVIYQILVDSELKFSRFCNNRVWVSYCVKVVWVGMELLFIQWLVMVDVVMVRLIVVRQGMIRCRQCFQISGSGEVVSVCFWVDKV